MGGHGILLFPSLMNLFYARFVPHALPTTRRVRTRNRRGRSPPPPLVLMDRLLPFGHYSTILTETLYYSNFFRCATAYTLTDALFANMAVYLDHTRR